MHIIRTELFMQIPGIFCKPGPKTHSHPTTVYKD